MLIYDSFKGPKELQEKLESGRWIVLVARNSGQGGKRARQLAADEVYKAAQGLQDKTGIDVMKALPTRASIVTSLEQAKSIKSLDPTGASFTNEYVTITLSSVKIIIFVSTGSGKKLDALYMQPFVQELIALTLLHKPALIFANRLDRIFRRMLTGAELLNVIEAVGGYLGDSEGGIRSADTLMQLMTLMEASGAEKEAALIPRKTREGMIAGTDSVMVNGSLRYAMMSTPPAGTIRLTLKSEKGTTGAKMLYLDDPKYFPEESDVLMGYPDKSLVKKKSNVELIQWALKHLGLPGYTQATVGEYLAAQGFSTPGIRRAHGVNACFEPTDKAVRRHLPMRAILFNLEFYETGVLKISLGVAGVKDFDVTGCFPLPGKWAQPSDFKRIKRYLSESTGGGPGVLGLVGVTVQTVGGLCRLSTTHNIVNSKEPAYDLLEIGEQQGRRSFPALPHSVLAESIIVGLIKATETVWIPIESQADHVNPGLQAEIVKVGISIESSIRRCEMILNQINEFDDFGIPLLDSQTRQDLGSLRTQILTEVLAPEKKRLEDLERHLYVEMEKQSQISVAAPDNLLNALIASLKDHSNTTYNRLWKSCLKIESMTKVKSISRGHGKATLIWRGTLKISSFSNTFEIPFSGSFATGTAMKVDERVQATIKLLGQGIPITEMEIPQMRELKSSVAQAMGIESRRFNLGSCLDPRILKIGVFVINQPTMTDAQIGIHFDEPELLISRIRESFLRQPFGSRWVSSPSVVKSNWFYTASLNQGLVTQAELLKLGSSNWVDNFCKMKRTALKSDAWLGMAGMSAQLAPCEYCGSFRRSTSRLFEPVGMICLDCHLDEAKLNWPSDPYDQWLNVAGME